MCSHTNHGGHAWLSFRHGQQAACTSVHFHTWYVMFTDATLNCPPLLGIFLSTCPRLPLFFFLCLMYRRGCSGKCKRARCCFSNHSVSFRCECRKAGQMPTSLLPVLYWLSENMTDWKRPRGSSCCKCCWQRCGGGRCKQRRCWSGRRRRATRWPGSSVRPHTLAA